MGKSVVRAIGLAMGVLALAGCVEDPGTPEAYSFVASGGKVSDGYAYDGSGVVEGAARLAGMVDRVENTGGVGVSFTFAGSEWEVMHDTFVGSEEWKDGGVAFGLVEHGDTGVSSTIIPRIDGEVVTYGTAQVMRDGEPAVDPGGEEGPWQAHLMLSSSTIRGGDGRIVKADGSTPYDPASPGDASIVGDDPQGFLQLVAPTGPDSARAAQQVNETVSVMGPESRGSVDLGGGPGAQVTVNVTTQEGTVPLQAGDLTLRLVDAEGTVHDSAGGNVLPQEPFSASLSASGMNSTVSLELVGNGTFDVGVESRAVYDDHPFIIVTWDEYELEVVDPASGT